MFLLGMQGFPCVFSLVTVEPVRIMCDIPLKEIRNASIGALRDCCHTSEMMLKTSYKHSDASSVRHRGIAPFS